MKKSGIFNKFTIVDFIIIIIIVAAVGFALLHISPISNQSDSTSFDSSTLDKVTDKYLSYYIEGDIVKTTIEGINITSGKDTKIEGTVLWCDDNFNNKNLKVLVDDNGKKILAGTYKDTNPPDIYIKQMTLEVNGDKYKNITEVTLSPMNISSFSDLNKGLKNNNNYELSTTISSNNLDTASLQEVTNQLNNITKKPSISLNINNVKVSKANKEDIDIANSEYKTLNGQTTPITIRIYNCTNEELQTINDTYSVESVKHIN